MDVTVYDMRYAQRVSAASGTLEIPAEEGPSIGTFWERPKNVPAGCKVVEISIPEELAEEVCE